MTGGPSIVFTRKAILLKTVIRGSSNICKSNVGIDAIPIQYVKICQQDCTKDGSLILIFKNSRLDINNLTILRTKNKTRLHN